MVDTQEQEYDPFAAFVDVVSGSTRDPYPDFAEKRRNSPVWKGRLMSMDFLPEGFEGEPEWNAFRYEDCSRILRDAKTFTSTALRRHHRHGHGPHDPGHGRPGAPRAPQPGRPRVPGEVVGPLGTRVHRTHHRRIDRSLRPRRRSGPGPPAHVRVPGAGDRPPARAARGGLRTVPALVDRAHLPRGRHRPGHWQRQRRSAITSPNS